MWPHGAFWSDKSANFQISNINFYMQIQLDVYDNTFRAR